MNLSFVTTPSNLPNSYDVSQNNPPIFVIPAMEELDIPKWNIKLGRDKKDALCFYRTGRNVS